MIAIVDFEAVPLIFFVLEAHYMKFYLIHSVLQLLSGFQKIIVAVSDWSIRPF